MGLLTGREALVVGVTNHRSIGWGIARALAREGAALTMTYHRERSRQHLEKLTGELEGPCRLLPLDVTDDASVTAMGEALEHEIQALDVLVHSVANAKVEDLSTRFVQQSRDGWRVAHDVSAFSLVALTRAVLPLLEAAGDASIMAISYMGSDRVLPHYNVMGPAKASLEAAVRYLAHDLGPSGIRVNAISPGPVKTLSAAGVKGFAASLGLIEEKAPLHRNISIDDIGNAAAFLGSSWARNVTGQILFVDSGHHIMGI